MAYNGSSIHTMNGMHLVRAIELKEADASTVIHLITVGAADAEPIIRKALGTWW